MQVKNKVFCWDVPSRVHTYQVLTLGLILKYQKRKKKREKSLDRLLRYKLNSIKNF